MKRAAVLFVALGMIATGLVMDPPHAKAEESAGNHFVKGKIAALESCYGRATSVTSTCLGVIETNGVKHAGKIVGDLQIGRAVYLECRTESGSRVCSENWTTSVGERYVEGGEIAAQGNSYEY